MDKIDELMRLAHGMTTDERNYYWFLTELMNEYNAGRITLERLASAAGFR